MSANPADPWSSRPARDISQAFDGVIVPLDGSDDGVHALRVGAALSQRLACPVTAISFASSESLRQLERRIRRLVRRELAGTPFCVTIRRCHSSVAADILLEMALWPNAILCMPPRGLGQSVRAAGSVATPLLAALPRAVLLVGPVCDGLDFDPSGLALIAAESVIAAESLVAEHSPSTAQTWIASFGSSAGQTIAIEDSAHPVESARRVAGAARTIGASVIMLAQHSRQVRPEDFSDNIAAHITRFAHCPVLVHR